MYDRFRKEDNGGICGARETFVAMIKTKYDRGVVLLSPMRISPCLLPYIGMSLFHAAEYTAWVADHSNTVSRCGFKHRLESGWFRNRNASRCDLPSYSAQNREASIQDGARSVEAVELEACATQVPLNLSRLAFVPEC